MYIKRIKNMHKKKRIKNKKRVLYDIPTHPKKKKKKEKASKSETKSTVAVLL